MRLLKLFYLFFLSFSVNAMDEFIIASAGQVVEPTPQIEEPKHTEVKPEDPPFEQATDVPTEKTIPEKDMQAEIDNDLNQKDIEEVKAESSSTLKKITETEAKTEKNPVNETVEQITNDVPVDTKSANLESPVKEDTSQTASSVENSSDSNISKPRIIGASPMPVMHDEAMKALKTLIGDLDKIKFDKSSIKKSTVTYGK